MGSIFDRDRDCVTVAVKCVDFVFDLVFVSFAFLALGLAFVFDIAFDVVPCDAEGGRGRKRVAATATLFQFYFFSLHIRN